MESASSSSSETCDVDAGGELRERIFLKEKLPMLVISSASPNTYTPLNIGLVMSTASIKIYNFLCSYHFFQSIILPVVCLQMMMMKMMLVFIYLVLLFLLYIHFFQQRISHKWFTELWSFLVVMGSMHGKNV